MSSGREAAAYCRFDKVAAPLSNFLGAATKAELCSYSDSGAYHLLCAAKTNVLPNPA